MRARFLASLPSCRARLTDGLFTGLCGKRVHPRVGDGAGLWLQPPFMGYTAAHVSGSHQAGLDI